MTNGIFNLEKFRSEVKGRVKLVREAQEEGRLSINYIRNEYSHALAKRHVASSVSNHEDGAETAVQHQPSSSPSKHKKLTSLDPKRGIPPTSSFLVDDPLRAGRLQWVHPEKWYSLTPLSAQSSCDIEDIRYQYHKPRLPPRPSESPYSALPTRVLENPVKVETKTRKKKGASHYADTSSSHKVPVKTFGHMRKCQNPFNEGWKIATFKPIDERLIPYRAVVKKWIPQSKYGFLDWDGQEVFVHKSQVMDNDLQVGEHVLFEVNTLGKHQLEAKNVRKYNGEDAIPEGMHPEYYRDLVTRRDYAEENRKIFATGFWKYPPSEETLEAEKGGLGRMFSPFEHGVKKGGPQSPSALESEEKGPQLGQKLDRKPWLTKFIAKSASRNPPKMPGDEAKCESEADVTASLRLLLHLPHRELAGRAGAGEALQHAGCSLLEPYVLEGTAKLLLRRVLAAH
uniref:CSD domain-containing protein n=1 Tax=Guillardia theta TaxID=55529 RepID=A0A7S4L265_GUITH|mmetsp:Transcript_35608/g.111401  ORF Transcript_35608/g.111401 Transcript_35608/m.111401 type:complete len:454 (+) Transcript_35608:140-1501(+)